MRNRSILAATLAALLSTPLAAEIVVHDPYVRAMPPGQPNTAAFMQIENRGEQGRAVVEARSDVSEVVELHTHSHVDGMMQMRRIERIELPAGEMVELQPGGLHVMLIGLLQPLAAGERVALELVLDDGSGIEVDAEVREVMPHPHRHGGMHGMQHSLQQAEMPSQPHRRGCCDMSH